jgi:hypothetical protein
MEVDQYGNTEETEENSEYGPVDYFCDGWCFDCDGGCKTEETG